MADETPDAPADTDDLGEPIAELRGLSDPPSAGFVDRLRRALQRRSLSSQLVRFGWSGLGTVLLEFLRIVYALFENKPTDTDRGGPR